MICFVIKTYAGFGLGKTYTEAKELYQKHNGRLRTNTKYKLYVINVNRFDDLEISQDNINVKKGAKIIYSNTEN